MAARLGALLNIGPTAELICIAVVCSFTVSVAITAAIIAWRKRKEAEEVAVAVGAQGPSGVRSDGEDHKRRPQPAWSVAHYTGGECPMEPASNMLVTDPAKTHRSAPGSGAEQDLALECALPDGAACSFDRIQVMGANAGPTAGAANALRTGLVWIFKKRADMPQGFLEEGMAAFKGFTRQQFQAYDRSRPDAPFAFFETRVPAAARDARPPSCQIQCKGTEAEVVCFKFLTTHGDGACVSVAAIIFHQEVDDEPSSVGGFVLGKHLGSGGFGDVFAGYCVKTKEKVAIKIEQEDVIKSVIRVEAYICQRLNPDGTTVGFPRVLWRGSNCFVMDLMGPSLEDLLRAMPERKFSLKTTLLLAYVMLERLQYLHRRSYVHRDVKPDNFIFGLDSKRNVLHLCDFGLSARYRDRTTMQHIKYLEGRSVYGTPYFVSLNAHYGIEQTTRDDLESLGYCLVYFAKGTLPWLGLRGQGVRRSWHSRVAERKRNTSIKSLCEGLPKEFASYLTYVRGLSFGEYADYNYCRDLFAVAYGKAGFQVDEPTVYDWTEVGRDWPCWTESGAPPRWRGEVPKEVRTRDDMPEACVRDVETLPAVVGAPPTK
eukprot:TRINITY_DN59907_c0_g1_i1.p1 TRINITY_DN59907_c0_g1~~TRINITY_DN59907_c0_g1_i1.p1  ORF type:complete len:599 (+),score=187.23 TRINITY_DN59907_c0_g1_i1:93-1889(+)